MFERFTRAARDVVASAVAHAQESGAARVTEEHMLAGLLDREGSRGSFALGALGLGDAEGRERLRADLTRARRRGGMSREDEAALASLGVDLTEIVSRVEEAHGEGAFARSATPRRGGRTSRHLPFSKGAKSVLERALKQAVSRGDGAIGDEHVLLALLSRPGVVAEVLADHGVTTASVERVLYGRGGEGSADERMAG